MTYSTYANKSKSEKLVLCWIEPVKRFLIWTSASAPVYTRSESLFVIDVVENGTSLVNASSSSLSSGEWYYDADAGTLYIRTSDDSDPNTKTVVGTYRMFFANAPIDLPWDLSTGSDVHYEGLLKSNSPITKALDDEQTGVALESNTRLIFDNTSGYFDEYYDILFFENKRVRLYSWSDSIVMSEKKLIFDGQIQDKSFDPVKNGFKCKDFVYKLREPVPLSLFSASDGDVSDTHLGSPKRRIYGRVDKARCVPIDNTLGGYGLTGTISGIANSLVISGNGTAFLDECSPGDKLFVVLLNETIELTVDDVTSDISLIVSDEVTTSFTNKTTTNLPERPWRKKNRRWHIAGHKLRAPSTTVTSATEANRFVINDPSDLFANDLISVNGEDAFIKRISGSNVVLKSNLQSGTPSASDPVLKNPVSNVYIENKESFINRDWTVSNTTEAVIVFENDAEVNLARPRPINGSLTFTNGSRTVTATGINLTVDIEPRDWIRGSDITHTTYYEVLSVTEDSLIIRTAYAGVTDSGSSAKLKKPDFINDDSVITASCVGMEYDGVWVKTASDAVKNLVSIDAGLSIDSDSFSSSNNTAPFTLALIIPEDIGGQLPKIRDVITSINTSVMGSLVNNGNWDLSYNILTPDRPTTLEAVEDHDIIGQVSIKSNNKIVRKINAEYCPFVDIYTGNNTFKLIEYENSFVDTYIGAKEEKDVKLFLYDYASALEVAERYGLYNSLSQSVVTIKAKLGFMLNNLNDKIYLNMDRLYKRFGGRDRRKIGTISKITKNGSDTSVEFNDLSNVFNRVFAVADNSSNDFTSANNDEKIVNGYVLDDNLEIPDITDEDYYGAGLIG